MGLTLGLTGADGPYRFGIPVRIRVQESSR